MVFLRAYSRLQGAQSGLPVIYEAAWDAATGQVTETVPAPADLRVVQWIQVYDPLAAKETVVADFSVFGGTLKPQRLLWQKLDFETRCFLAPDNSGSVPVHLEFKASTSGVVLRGSHLTGGSSMFTAFDPIPDVALAGMDRFSFTSNFNAFLTPDFLKRLGVDAGVQAGPQLTGITQPGGVRFQLALPLSGTLSSYGLELGKASITCVQRQARPDQGSLSSFWVLELIVAGQVVFDWWNDDLVPVYLDSLTTVRSGLPASFVPTIALNAGQNTNCMVSYAILDRYLSKGVKLANCVLRDPESRTKQGSVNIVSRRIELVPGTSLNCTVTFSNLKTASGDALQAACLIEGPDPKSTPPEAVSEPVAGLHLMFRHQFDPPGATASQAAVRMGSLDLCLPVTALTKAQSLAGRTDGVIQASIPTKRNANGDDVAGSVPKIRLDDLRIDLAVTSLGIGGQDDAPGFEYAPLNQPYPRGGENYRRANSVQIPIHDFPPTGDYLVLNVSETCYEGTSQTLSLRIEQQRLSTGGSGDLKLLAIDPEPFFVGQVFVPDYQESLREAITDQIASWDNNAADSVWQISAGTQAFELTLPPQGVTEAMHKDKNLAQPDITPGDTADSRFTPPAVFDLRSSAKATRFVEAPWNLRRVLGSPADAVPGAVVDRANFELLYGISATVQAKPGLLMAEIGARIGQLAEAPPETISWWHSGDQEGRYDEYTAFWAGLLPQLRTRVAALEPWSLSTPAVLTLTDDQLTFNLRTAADLAYPVEGGTAPDGVPDGDLKGSFAWAFDSDRLYNGLWTQTKSFSGQANGLAFSALGGWGQFTARFNLGKTSVIVAVRMGRIQTLTIEQIGRIGNFWNRAKLVITYERTVEATRQFYLQQNAFAGVPILRKTAEYVQILEKRRDAAAGDTTGPYSACEFPLGDPPRIPVDSAWGENVGNDGYRIPLWKPGAQPTDVYVKPVVVLHLKSDGEGNTAGHAICDPEKLFFYTTASASASADSDTWAKQVTVDYGYVTRGMVNRKGDTSTALANSKGRGDGFGAPKNSSDEEPWIEPGLGAFTYTLEPGTSSVNMTAGLGSGQAVNPIGAVMRTITIMRGLDSSAILPDDHAYATSLKIADSVRNTLRPVVSRIQTSAQAADTLASQIKTFAQQATARATDFEKFVGQLGQPGQVDLCKTLGGQLGNQLTILKTQIENELAGLLRGISDYLLSSSDSLPDLQRTWNNVYSAILSQLKFTGSQVLSLADTLKKHVDATFQSLIANLTNFESNLTDPATAPDVLASCGQTLDELLANEDAFIGSVLRPVAGGSLDLLRQQIAVLRNDLSDIVASASVLVAQGVDKAEQELDTLRQQFNQAQTRIDGLIDSMKHAATAFAKTKLETLLATIDADVRTATDLTAFRAAEKAKLNAFSSGLIQTIDDHLTELQNGIGGYAAIACNNILQTDLNAVLAQVKSIAGSIAIGRFFDSLTKTLTTGEDAASRVENYLHSLESSVGGFVNAVLPSIPLPKLPGVNQNALSLFLFRGFGDVPKVPQLDFAQDFTAFRFGELVDTGLPNPLSAINLSPLAALANEYGDSNPLNLHIPVTDLLDRLVPFDLSQFDFNSLIPHIAGMDLSNLFGGIRLPQGADKNVKISHGEDPQALSAWVEIDVNVPLADSVQVFSYFGVTITLTGATFTASARIAAQVGQPVTRSLSGSVFGSWSVAVGGFEVVVFDRCTLSFDQSGHFGFDITPAKVKPQAVLEFLSDLIADFFSGDGVTTSVTSAGLKTVLDLPLPDIQAGTFGIANLRLTTSFAMEFADFTLRVGFGLASLENPFTLTVFILGGAGYLSMDAAYTPTKNKISTTLAVGIFASAGLAISLGPISGSIYAYFGISVSYHAETGSAPDLQISLDLMFIGQVSLLGFISVSLMLSLSATYDSTSHVLIGRGTVSYCIKISFFFTINVSASVSYQFSNDPPPAGQLPPQGDYDAAAAEYVAMFGN